MRVIKLILLTLVTIRLWSGGQVVGIWERVDEDLILIYGGRIEFPDEYGQKVRLNGDWTITEYEEEE